KLRRVHNFFPGDRIPQKKSPFGKSSYLQKGGPCATIIQEAFQYPTRLGRTARCAGRLLFMASRQKRRPPQGSLLSLPSSAAAPLTVDAAVQVGHLPLRGGEEV